MGNLKAANWLKKQ